MCGIVGVLNLAERPPVEETVLREMLTMIRHRGPDGFGIYRDARVGLGSARLSIIDLSGGDQPIGNEQGTLWIVYNGEVFNYVELRAQLEARGHRFTTHTDTEVILHLYEDEGPGCLKYLNGQFALAIWDAQAQRLFLARDRLGVRPLFYTVHDGRLVFGSEVKALLAHPGISAHIDPAALRQVFTFWSTLSPSTIFSGVEELPPGHYALVEHGQLDIRPYWVPAFGDSGPVRTTGDYLEELENLLIDATRVRLRADVTVGAYLSGGLDSSTITAIIRRYTQSRLDTFSIAFVDNPEFDESHFQRQMAAYLGTDHRVVECKQADIGRAFPEVVWHTETAILRTAPAPMFLLSQLVHDAGIKVVLTGEGADEFLAGYDLFKEMKVRRFWARQPESILRPLLLRKLYPDITDLGSVNETYLRAFYKRGLADTTSPYYSHALRWSNTARMLRFLDHGASNGVGAGSHSGSNGYAEFVALPPGFSAWTPLAQAQYLEVTTFLSPYLLSSQGDRMAMAHAVEGRYPFLDWRVVEFCGRLPDSMKLHGLTEKWLLKQLGQRLLPPEIGQRRKRPYRAPIQFSFFGSDAPDYVRELLSEPALRESGLFNAGAVAQLTRKAQEGQRLSEVDGMALTGILSTQLLHHRFVKAFKCATVLPSPRVKIVDRVTAHQASVVVDA